MKKSFETGGPLVFAVAWLVLAGGAYGRWLWVTPFSVWTLLVGMAMGGGAGILLFRAAGSLRRQKNSVHARVNIWSSARPGEVMVGVLHTGTERRDPAGLVLNLDCLEQNSGGQWLLWSSQVCSPAPTGPDAWPFHFSIPLEGPPSGPSTDGHVVWQLRAKSVSLPIFEARFDVVVARVAGPPSHLLPVPPPRFGKGTAPRRSVVLIEQPGQRVLRLGSRFAFPGPNPLVVWTVGGVGVLMILAKRKAPPWAYGIFGVVAGGAALFFALLWFGREEMIVSDHDIVIRRRLWKFSKQWRFPRSAVTGVRVAFSGPPPHFGVRIERGEERPLAVFDGFTDSLDAHEAARSVLRALEHKK